MAAKPKGPRPRIPLLGSKELGVRQPGPAKPDAPNALRLSNGFAAEATGNARKMMLERLHYERRNSSQAGTKSNELCRV